MQVKETVQIIHKEGKRGKKIKIYEARIRVHVNYVRFIVTISVPHKRGKEQGELVVMRQESGQEEESLKAVEREG